MRRIRGFVCVGEADETSCLFGPSGNDRSCENLSSNNLGVFDRAHKALDAAERLMTDSVFNKVGTAKIRMDIADDKEEWVSFKKSRRLVVIFKDDLGYLDFLGRIVEGRRSAYPVPGGFLYENGLAPITRLESAEYVLSELQRQGGVPAWLGMFKLGPIRWLNPEEQVKSAKA